MGHNFDDRIQNIWVFRELLENWTEKHLWLAGVYKMEVYSAILAGIKQCVGYLKDHMRDSSCPGQQQEGKEDILMSLKGLAVPRLL